MSETVCQSTNWKTDRNSKWADGDVYCGLYDHYRLPNAPEPDCISGTYSWRAARGKHSGGVNLLTADGSVRFISNGIDPDTWHGLGSRAGSEVLKDF